MAKKAYIGQNGTARKVKKLYVGIEGVARKVKKAYVGVDGIARLVYKSEITPPFYTGTYSLSESDGYRYMFLLDSGILTVTDSAKYDLFAVGGGGSGG